MAEIINQSILNKSRKDKFVLSLSIPEALKEFVTKSDRRVDEKSYQKVIPDSLQFSIYGAVVPEISVTSEEVPYLGQTLKVSGHARPAYDDITVNFTVDNEYNNYWYIWRWLQVLNDPKHSVYDHHDTSPVPFDKQRPPRLLEDYQSDFTLYGLNEANKNAIKFTYTKAFPTALGEISYNYRDTEEIESSFTFSFTQMLVNLQ